MSRARAVSAPVPHVTPETAQPASRADIIRESWTVPVHGSERVVTSPSGGYLDVESEQEDDSFTQKGGELSDQKVPSQHRNL